MRIKKTDGAGMEYARKQSTMACDLKKRRKEMGLTLMSVSRSANISYCSLWAFETGRNVNVTLSFLMAYAEAVGLELTLSEVKH